MNLGLLAHFLISILACDPSGHCERFRVPIEADSKLQCQMTMGTFAEVRWAQDHKSWQVKEWHCAEEGESDL